MLLNNGSVLLVMTLRVITNDGPVFRTSSSSTMNIEKGGTPLNDGFLKLRVMVSEPMSVTLRLVGSLAGAGLMGIKLKKYQIA